MPGRSYTATSSYRYGFNGKENDPETYGKGNIYDYGFRIFSPRLGKFLSVDPLFEGYPYYSPYQFAGNMPIVAIDLDGLEQYVVIYYKDQSNQTTKIKIRAIVNNDGSVQNQHLHKYKDVTKKDVANGNVLVFEIKKDINNKEIMNIVDKRNTADGKLTKQELSIFTKNKKLENETDKTEALVYPSEDEDNLQYESRDFENKDTKTYSATYGIVRQPRPAVPVVPPQLNASFEEYSTTLHDENGVENQLKSAVKYLKNNRSKVIEITPHTLCTAPGGNCSTTMPMNGKTVTKEEAARLRGEAIKDLLIKMGVPASQIKVNSGSQINDTHETHQVPIDLKISNR